MTRTICSVIIISVALAQPPHAIAQPQYDTGASDTEIRIGNTTPYSGGASIYAAIGKAEAAYFQMVNDQGGVNGRKITFISLDDGYSPPKTVEQTRRLVEQDNVLLIFAAFGTATVSATQRYLNTRNVPQLFPVSGASKWDDRQQFPTIRGWQPTYQMEGQIFARYILENKPDGKIGVLYQNDDYGKDYLKGLKDGLGAKAAGMVVKEVTYQGTDGSIDSQLVTLQAADANVFVDITTAKFAAQAIRKMHDIGWRPLHLLNSISTSVSSVLQPAGLEKSTGIISVGYSKDPTDPRFAADPAVLAWRAWMTKYDPDGDAANINNAIAYSRAMTLVATLKQCGDVLTHDNVLRQADNLNLHLPMLLPGIDVQTAPNRFSAIHEMQLERFNGTSWEHFGDLMASE